MTVAEPVAVPAPNAPSDARLARSSRLEALEFPDRASYDLWSACPAGQEQGWRSVLGWVTRTVVRAEVPGGPVFVYCRRARWRKNRQLRPPAFLSRQGGPIRLHAGHTVPAPVSDGEPAPPGVPVLMPGSPGLDTAPVLRPWMRAMAHHVAAALTGFPPAPLPDLRTVGEEPVEDGTRLQLGRVLPWEFTLGALELTEVFHLGSTRYWRWPYGPVACATTLRGGIDWVDPLSWRMRVRLRCDGCDRYLAFARLFSGRPGWSAVRAARGLLAGLTAANAGSGFDSSPLSAE